MTERTGICGYCRRWFVRLRKDGRMYRHLPDSRHATLRCPGSGKAPERLTPAEKEPRQSAGADTGA